MNFIRILALLAVAAPTMASAQTMNAEVFLTRSKALMAKGPMAIFSGGEIKALMGEGQAAGNAARQARLADVAAGRPPRYCPPPGKQGMGSNEFIQRLSAIPAAERARINMTEAMVRIFIQKFPCPK